MKTVHIQTGLGSRKKQSQNAITNRIVPRREQNMKRKWAQKKQKGWKENRKAEWQGESEETKQIFRQKVKAARVRKKRARMLWLWKIGIHRRHCSYFLHYFIFLFAGAPVGPSGRSLFWLIVI